MTSLKTPSTERRRRLLRWHRRVGVAASLIILAIVATGIPLNHSEKLGLDRLTVGSEIMQYWYGMPSETKPTSFSVGADRLTWYQDTLYFNEDQLIGKVDPIIGAALLKSAFVVATNRELLIFTNEGSLVEKLSGADIPGDIKKIGVKSGSTVILLTPSGQYSSSGDFLEWMAHPAATAWIDPLPNSGTFNEKLRKIHFGQGVPWSRFLMDIHTGRLLGNLGPYLIDLVALCVLFLLGSGLYNSLRR
jgi:uncharacterized iron-regulated membrane protein